MSESGDYNPGPWKGHDFASARKTYDAYVGRSYSDAVSGGKATKDLIPESISTDSTAPIIIVIDETGSMGDWPATIFSKLPYLENEGKEYLGEDFEIAFMAIGDAHNGEKYPLQVRPFAKGLELKDRLKELVIEGQGGSQTYETYELAGLYSLLKVNIPKAIKPILIFIGDESAYDDVDRDQAKELVGVDLEKALPTQALFDKLKEKYSVYLIRKPYGSGYSRSDSNTMSDLDKRIVAQWEKLVGVDHIAHLPKAERVVDVIFGIFAKETGRVAYFENELEDRQLKDKDGDKKIDMVYKSLKTIHNITDAKREAGKHTGKPVMKRVDPIDPSKEVKPLI